MTKLDDGPTGIPTNLDTCQVETEKAILNTIAKCEGEGLNKLSLYSIKHTLNQLRTCTDLFNPEAVKAHISRILNVKTGKPLENSTKQKHANNYNYFVEMNILQWKKPVYKIVETIPLIPTKEKVNAIISASSKKYATIFTILAETGLEGAELASMDRDQIDAEQGTISSKGCKGHNSRTFKFKTATAEMQRVFMFKYTKEKPFPSSKVMGEQWRTFRDRLADKLNQPDIKKVQMRNLRNYSGAQMYFKIPDPITIMRHLGHKKLETTMHYLRGFTLEGEEEYTVKAATTLKEATELLEQGFQYVTDMDRVKLFRKRK